VRHILLSCSFFILMIVPSFAQNLVKLANPELDRIREEVREGTASDEGRRMIVDRGAGEIFAWHMTGDRTRLEKARAAFQGYLEGSKIRMDKNQPLAKSIFIVSPVLLTYQALKEQKMISPEAEATMRKIATRIIEIEERGTNNRSTQNATATALGAKLFPDLPEAKAWKAYAEAVWGDWNEIHDTHENAYSRHHTEPLFNLAEALDKTKELKHPGFHKMMLRYRDMLSPSGLWALPGDEMPFSQAGMTDVFMRAALLYKDPTLAWASIAVAPKAEQQSGGFGPTAPPRVSVDELLKRFKAAGIEPKMPDNKSEVLIRYGTTDHPAKDKLILCPSREPKHPFASFDIYDRSDKMQHGHQNKKGELTYYEVDGVPMLHHLSYGAPDAAAANVFLISEAHDQYPYRLASPIVAGHWYKAQTSLRQYLTAMPTKKYPINEKNHPALIAQPYGHRYLYNPDTLTGKLDKINLNSITIRVMINKPGDKMTAWAGREWSPQPFEPAPSDKPIQLIVDRIRLIGPKGEVVLEDFEKNEHKIELGYIPPEERAGSNTAIVAEKDSHTVPVAERGKWMKVTSNARDGKGALEVTCRQGVTLLRLKNLNLDFDVSNDYTRLEFDYHFIGDTRKWGMVPVAVQLNRSSNLIHIDRQAGGILEDAQASQKGKDSYGFFRFRDYFTAGTLLTRRTVLTQEGIMVVRDELTPGSSSEGMMGGPVWHLFSPPEQGLNWFDSPGVRKEYGADKKRLLVYFDQPYSKDAYIHRYGQQYIPYAEPYPKGIGGGRGGRGGASGSYAAYAQAVLKAGVPETFVTVMVPHNMDVSGRELADTIQTSTDQSGKTTVKIGNKLTVEMDGSANWSVSRQQ
jgi:hypothetical protein